MLASLDKSTNVCYSPGTDLMAFCPFTEGQIMKKKDTNKKLLIIGIGAVAMALLIFAWIRPGATDHSPDVLSPDPGKELGFGANIVFFQGSCDAEPLGVLIAEESTMPDDETDLTMMFIGERSKETGECPSYCYNVTHVQLYQRDANTRQAWKRKPSTHTTEELLGKKARASFQVCPNAIANLDIFTNLKVTTDPREITFK